MSTATRNPPDPDATAREKYDRDQAMTLTEHALTSGYGKSSLKEMKLPLIHGKIAPSDFRRILRRRQDELETARFAEFLKASGESIATHRSRQLTVGKFRAPR